MRMMQKMALAAVVSAAMLAGPAYAANLIVNGGFENPHVASGYTTLSGAALPNWSIDSGNIDIVAETAYPAFEGTQALDLVGTGVSTGSISQGFATVAGQRYRLTFAYTNNTDNPSLVSGTASVTGTGTLLTAPVSHANGTAGTPNWMTYTGVFTADSASTTLSFADGSGHGNQGLFIDAVSVAGVPEPATWAMMIGGFGLVGGAMRRRGAATLATA